MVSDKKNLIPLIKYFKLIKSRFLSMVHSIKYELQNSKFLILTLIPLESEFVQFLQIMVFTYYIKEAYEPFKYCVDEC